jgi:ATP-dependent Clp protease protease subunit
LTKDNKILERLYGRRIVLLGSDIKQGVADEVRAKLLEMALESKEEIRLLIDSNGGYSESSLSICDTIACLEAPVTGIVIGKCYSMAVTVLQCCKKRLSLPNATFLLHYISSHFDISYHLPEVDFRAILERRIEEGRANQLKNERIIANRTGLSIEVVRKLMRDGDVLDSHLSAGEAKMYGLIEQIVEDPTIVFASQASKSA